MDVNLEKPPLDQNPDDTKLLVSLTSSRPEVNDHQDKDLNIWLIILPVAIVVVIIVVGLLFYIKNRKKAL